MQRLPHAKGERIRFRWNGAEVEGRAGDTVASALYALGIRILARSRKRHRPLGLSGAFVAGVLGRVDGRPNVRLDREPLRQGLDARMQNVWPGARLDALALLRFLPARWSYSGFEHTNLLPSGTRRFDVWERLLAFLAGGGEAPRIEREEPPAGRRVEADLVVIGAGPAGCDAASAAAQRGERVVLLSRGSLPCRGSAAAGRAPSEIDSRVDVVPGVDAFGLYRASTLVVAAPMDGRAPAIVVAAKRVALATGRRSCPPLVPGADLPGVLDAHAALALAADHAVAPGRAVAVVGTGAEREVAARLRDLGVSVVETASVVSLRRIHGRRAVDGIDLGRRVACDALVHAGPWRPDPALPFQSASDGLLQLRPAAPSPDVERVGAAAEDAEPVAFDPDSLAGTMVCPCMDVSADEVMRHIRAGESDVEILKRLTSCGMGPCQGVPCWDYLAAVVAATAGGEPADYGTPTYRAPRRAITVAQAAGLDGLVEPDR